MARDACKVDRCVLKNRQRPISHQLVRQTGLPPIKTLRVEGFRESEKLVVQVVAEFMDQRPAPQIVHWGERLNLRLAILDA